MKITLLMVIILCMTSCSMQPDEIDYGKDACHYCKMNIVDKVHAAQIVTKKGRFYKYDAAECMLNDLKDQDRDKIGIFLVTDYTQPGKLIDATKATFLISDLIQSPMGENLSSFQSKESANRMILENDTGVLYNWNGIQQLFYTK